MDAIKGVTLNGKASAGLALKKNRGVASLLHFVLHGHKIKIFVQCLAEVLHRVSITGTMEGRRVWCLDAARETAGAMGRCWNHHSGLLRLEHS